MVHLNPKIFISYLVLAVLCMLVDLSMFADSNNLKSMARIDFILFIPMLVIGMVGYKANVESIQFDVFLGLDSLMFSIFFMVLIYHQTKIFGIEMYMILILAIVAILLVIGAILGHLKLGGNLYTELGIGSIIGITALAHLFTKYVKGNEYTVLFCYCGVLLSLVFVIGYHFGNKFWS